MDPLTEAPDEYVPTRLRTPEAPPRRPVTYACGVETRPNGYARAYAYWWGPCHLDECLEQIGLVEEGVPPDWNVIVRFNEDHTDTVVYRWTGRSWKKEPG